MAFARITQYLDNMLCKPFLDFTMPRDRLGQSSDRVPIPIMLRTVPNQLAAESFDCPNEFDPFHDTTRSSTLRIPGI